MVGLTLVTDSSSLERDFSLQVELSSMCCLSPPALFATMPHCLQMKTCMSLRSKCPEALQILMCFDFPAFLQKIMMYKLGRLFEVKQHKYILMDDCEYLRLENITTFTTEEDFLYGTDVALEGRRADIFSHGGREHVAATKSSPGSVRHVRGASNCHSNARRIQHRAVPRRGVQVRHAHEAGLSENWAIQIKHLFKTCIAYFDRTLGWVQTQPPWVATTRRCTGQCCPQWSWGPPRSPPQSHSGISWYSAWRSHRQLQ